MTWLVLVKEYSLGSHLSVKIRGLLLSWLHGWLSIENGKETAVSHVKIWLFVEPFHNQQPNSSADFVGLQLES